MYLKYPAPIGKCKGSGVGKESNVKKDCGVKGERPDPMRFYAWYQGVFIYPVLNKDSLKDFNQEWGWLDLHFRKIGLAATAKWIVQACKRGTELFMSALSQIRLYQGLHQDNIQENHSTWNVKET